MSNRIELEHAFVLHTRLYRETSLLVDAFTEFDGRVTFIAKGARRAKSAHKGLLQPFVPLMVSYLGKGELKTLTHAELSGPILSLTGEKLVSGLYLNELLTRLLMMGAPMPELFKTYSDTLQSLSSTESLSPRLRLFEKALLEALGEGICLTEDVHGVTIESDKHYLYVPAQGFYEVLPDTLHDKSQLVLAGEALLSLASEDANTLTTCSSVKRLLQSALKPLLGPKPLQSRALWATKRAQTE